jgi:exopolysaccharide production protein ExoZ
MSNADTQVRDKLIEIQYLRGIAALLVIVFHSAIFVGPGGPGYPLGFTKVGVELFFVISGFIIAHAHWHDASSWHNFKRYVTRRFTRIFPFLWVVVLGLALAAPVVQFAFAEPTLFQSSWSVLFSSLTLVPVGCGYVPGSLWSLSNEVLFYSIFALRYFSKRLFWSVSSVVLLLSIASMNVATEKTAQSCVAAVVASPYNIEFAMGVAAYFLAAALSRYCTPSHVAATFGLGLTLFAAAAISDVTMIVPTYYDDVTVPGLKYWKVAVRLCYSIASCLIVASAACRLKQRPHRSVSILSLRFLGDASYSLYLVHMPVIAVTGRVLGLDVSYHSGSWSVFLVLCVASVLVGILTHVAIERPLLHHLVGKAKPRVVNELRHA